MAITIIEDGLSGEIGSAIDVSFDSAVKAKIDATHVRGFTVTSVVALEPVVC